MNNSYTMRATLRTYIKSRNKNKTIIGGESGLKDCFVVVEKVFRHRRGGEELFPLSLLVTVALYVAKKHFGISRTKKKL